MKRLLAILMSVLMVCTLAMPVMADESTPENAFFSVTINGETKYYDTTDSMISSITSGSTATVELLKDYEGPGFTTSGRDNVNISINLNGYEWKVTDPLVGSTGTETNAFQLLKGNKISFSNGAIVSDVAAILFQNYCDLTITDVDVTLNTISTGSYVLSNNNGSLNLNGDSSVTSAHGTALDSFYWPDSYPDGVEVNINITGTITGDIELSADADDVNEANNYINFINGELVGEIRLGTLFESNQDKAKANIKVSGGTFTSNPSAYVDQESQPQATIGSTYAVGRASIESESAANPGATVTLTNVPTGTSLKLPEGTTVKNETSTPATVNGIEVSANGGEITTPDPTPEESRPTYRPSSPSKDLPTNTKECQKEFDDEYIWSDEYDACVIKFMIVDTSTK